jgi:hypothetical protein
MSLRVARKAWPLLFALLGAGAAAFAPTAEEPWVLLLSGDTDGYLSPCGCSKPMSGGIRRRVSAIRELAPAGRSVVLDNGAWAGGASRQDEIKAETMAEVLGALGVAAANFTPVEARLGRGALLSLQRLSQGALVSASIRIDDPPVPAYTVRGPFAIVGATAAPSALATPVGGTPVDLDQAIATFLADLEDDRMVPIVLLHGSRDDAERLARRFPTLGLIQYRGAGDPPAKSERVGRTMLVTPGEKGKHLLRLTFSRGEFHGYLPVRLDPQFGDDEAAQRMYSTYLSRVDREGLLDKLVRRDGPAFAGTETCGKCHAEAHDIWKDTRHAGALATLEKEGHSRDPDCVGCHVVGLDQVQGFRSRALTPHLADVGCESCHGPGLDHARLPIEHPMPKVGAAACAPCHVPEHSPGFDFLTYWERIRHR